MSTKLITLVHGTFAQNADWTLPGSEFRRGLEARTEEKLCFESFGWSGRNSHGARVNAAGEFAGLLRRQLKENPEGKKVIIAHSHGGNVALYALGMLGEAAREFELVTLATPFLNSEKRRIGIGELFFFLMEDNLEMAKLVFLWFPFLGGLPFLFPPFVRPHLSWEAVVLIWGVLIGLVFVYAFYLGRRLVKLRAVLSARQDEIMKYVSLDPAREVRMLSLIGHGDEIRWWFGRAAAAWEALIWVYSRALRVFSKYVYVMIPACLVYAGLRLALGPDFSPVAAKAERVCFLLGCLGVVFLSMGGMLGVILFALFAFFKSNILFLGLEDPEHQLFIRTMPADKPVNYQHLRFEEIRVKGKVLSLKHGLHTQEAVFPLIAAWMEGRGSAE